MKKYTLIIQHDDGPTLDKHIAAAARGLGYPPMVNGQPNTEPVEQFLFGTLMNILKANSVKQLTEESEVNSATATAEADGIGSTYTAE